MGYQTIFKRYEIKYMITKKQKERLLRLMEQYMKPDEFGETTIRNIYFDTDSYRLIRRSLEKPAYKEKLRVRSYKQADDDSEVFVELKKKFNSVVYKRRVIIPEAEAMDWLCGSGSHPQESQIADEIEYFRGFYEGLRPVVFLSYDREAYYSEDDEDFRVTFDENILYRENELSLESEIGGVPVLGGGSVLMEIKTYGGIPLWMAHFLCDEHIYKTSFSKYGAAYQKILENKNSGGLIYA